jgi:hypothetical protein
MAKKSDKLYIITCYFCGPAGTVKFTDGDPRQVKFKCKKCRSGSFDYRLNDKREE